MDFDEVAAKFRGCAIYGRHPEERIDSIESMIRRLETLESAGLLVNDLVSRQ